MKPNLAKTFIR